MKIAVIADIHANLAALEACLQDVHRQGVDEIVVNGDIVNRAPQNIEVLERLSQEHCHYVLGNHDDLMIKWIERSQDLPSEWFDSSFWRGTAMVAEELAQGGWLDCLRDIPFAYRLDLPDAESLLITHGSPDHYREGYGSRLSSERMGQIVCDHPADVYIGSHTHKPLLRWHEGKRFINTGAVGTSFNGDPRAHYLLLELRGSNWHADFRAVTYDLAKAISDFQQSRYFDEGGLGARLFFEELMRAKPIYSPFWFWAERHAREKNEANWQLFQREYPELMSQQLDIQHFAHSDIIIDQ